MNQPVPFTDPGLASLATDWVAAHPSPAAALTAARHNLTRFGLLGGFHIALARFEAAVRADVQAAPLARAQELGTEAERLRAQLTERTQHLVAVTCDYERATARARELEAELATERAVTESNQRAARLLAEDVQRLEAEVERLRDVLKRTQVLAKTDLPTCAGCGHLESAHDPAGERECNASAAQIWNCPCEVYVACYPEPMHYCDNCSGIDPSSCLTAEPAPGGPTQPA